MYIIRIVKDSLKKDYWTIPPTHKYIGIYDGGESVIWYESKHNALAFAKRKSAEDFVRWMHENISIQREFEIEEV